jgi:hypothetical protein
MHCLQIALGFATDNIVSTQIFVAVGLLLGLRSCLGVFNGRKHSLLTGEKAFNAKYSTGAVVYFQADQVGKLRRSADATSYSRILKA